ncbi:MAG: hypothetical protein LBP73_02660, partial [Clostridiales Family XIII bacterium]|nr:hypothetical protein [Clostridiales Family XIII bacterium]
MSGIWLHRISHESDVSYPLFERGYLSIGFSDFARDADFVKAMRDESGGDKWALFEAANDRIWSERYRGRYNLWRFLREFAVGDIVVVPSWGKFYICRITGEFQTAGAVDTAGLKDWNDKVVESDGASLRRNGKVVDIGFVRKIEMIGDPLSREEYADAKLSARMKIRQTNADISDLRSNVERAMDLAKSGKKLSYHRELTKQLRADALGVTREILAPGKFEEAVKWYLKKLGADEAYIPPKPKDDSEKRNGADADVIATFESLK